MLFACGSCQLMSLGPIVPGLLLTLLIMATTLSYEATSTPLWLKLLNLIGMLGLLFVAFALFPMALLLLWLIFAILMLTRLARQETRKVAGTGIVCVLVCVAFLTVQNMTRSPFHRIDSRLLTEHEVTFHAYRQEPMGLSVAELVSALDGPPMRHDNAKALLTARAQRADRAETSGTLELLQQRGGPSELEQVYRDRLERSSGS